MTVGYIALLRKQGDSDFSVEFPDFPGCVTAGRNLDESQAMAREALQFHIDGMIEDGEAVPDPSSLDDVMADPRSRDAVPVLVPARIGRGKAVRVNVTFDDRLLAELDALAESKGMSRSALLAEAYRRFAREEGARTESPLSRTPGRSTERKARRVRAR